MQHKMQDRCSCTYDIAKSVQVHVERATKGRKMAVEESLGVYLLEYFPCCWEVFRGACEKALNQRPPRLKELTASGYL